ncbi:MULTISPECIES: rhomboid family intramembrane serine protease [unclassified Halomonas]|uniref:rhomboid family intramembrane serine protease n=1 Tax=unclassified Halomonas TaxID=2609666 RepID=UPI00209D081A|nr:MULTISPECIES: rhomboid family intramembrane serine protease [unclassified Halomonas]MCP1315534.1 rhomboid family intramembrane serine protease [Halomonas sp. 707D7]MCP1326724.1 rhomboid family intramembrane serine protease [Halomonas sp. 707D4]
MHPVMLLPAETDTGELRQALWHYRIGHRITEERDGLLLWVADPRQQAELEALVARWQRGEVLIDGPRPKGRQAGQGARLVRRLPVTVVTIGLCLVVFALMNTLGDGVLLSLTIVPVWIVDNQVVATSLGETLASGQVWRLLSPAFLHFGLMHLIFNLMWVWYFGRQVEALQGSRMMLSLLVVAGIGANLAQYATGTVLFGGMSGVVYALLGHVWLVSRRRPQSGFFVPQMLVVFMLGWMVFTMTGLADSVGFGNVANEAHLGGLLVGLATGWYHCARHRDPAR